MSAGWLAEVEELAGRASAGDQDVDTSSGVWLAGVEEQVGHSRDSYDSNHSPDHRCSKGENVFRISSWSLPEPSLTSILDASGFRSRALSYEIFDA